MLVSVQAASLLFNAFFGQGLELYHPARWHMVLPSIREWAAMMVCHQCARVAFEQSRALEAIQFITQQCQNKCEMCQKSVLGCGWPLCVLKCCNSKSHCIFLQSGV